MSLFLCFFRPPCCLFGDSVAYTIPIPVPIPLPLWLPAASVVRRLGGPNSGPLHLPSSSSCAKGLANQTQLSVDLHAPVEILGYETVATGPLREAVSMTLRKQGTGAKRESSCRVKLLIRHNSTILYICQVHMPHTHR